MTWLRYAYPLTSVIMLALLIWMTSLSQGPLSICLTSWKLTQTSGITTKHPSDFRGLSRRVRGTYTSLPSLISSSRPIYTFFRNSSLEGIYTSTPESVFFIIIIFLCFICILSYDARTLLLAFVAHPWSPLVYFLFLSCHPFLSTNGNKVLLIACPSHFALARCIS